MMVMGKENGNNFSVNIEFIFFLEIRIFVTVGPDVLNRQLKFPNGMIIYHICRLNKLRLSLG